MRFFCSLLLLATSLTAAFSQPYKLTESKSPAAVGVSTERLQRLDRVLNEYVDQRKQAGIVALVVRNGQVVYHKAFGENGATTKAPLQRDAIMRIASQTKAITSVAVMMLFEEGRFLLDEPVSRYIPAFKNPTVIDTYNEKDTTYTTKPAKSEITIRQLLTHTSGISYPTIGTKEAVAIYAKAGIPSGIGTPMYSLSATIPTLAKLPLVHNPGEKWTYSLSTDVLGYLVEVVSGQSLDQFFRTRIFEPLGMNDTYFYLPASKHNRLATLYTETPGTREIVPMPVRGSLSPDYPTKSGTYYSGGAGLSSTAYDYAIFLQMILNGGEYGGKRLLAPATVGLMTQNQIGALNIGDNKFGLGLEITTEKSAAKLPVSVGLLGWGGYFGTNYWADPKTGTIGLIMTQKSPNSYGDLNDKFRVLVYQALEK
ncbi:serine hydrolase domain-containing protein [Fibrivirga algicola]|uniref:Beta-lactamase family protein n=1 Tax=Fibrivirga algicola TaxID=2950420 RepID=A0ABX0QB70_9BACT|nr:serine hydrolase domain-containing protein [Fibrivirga algicola]NID09286.1 beta-lactamase family protein [Fibrivirga algicola]